MADTKATRDIRRERLRVALETAVDKETIGLLELSKVWGVGKPAFVNVRDRIGDFPAAAINGKEYLYPRRAALLALDRYERRGDAANANRSARLAALVGLDPDDAHLSMSDLVKADQLQAQLEARRVAQGMLVPKAEVQAVAAGVFQILSRTLTDLGAVVDPNGIHPPEWREAADQAGQDLLLRIHAKMKDMLASDAQRTTRPNGDGSAARGARAGTAPGQRGGGVG